MIHKKYILAAFGFLFSLMYFSLAYGDKVMAHQRVTNYVNIRKTPSLNSPVIGNLRPQEQLDYMDSVDGWYKVQINDGKSGFVSKKWTKVLSVLYSSANKVVMKKGVKNYVNIRQTPSVRSSIIGTLKPGEKRYYIDSVFGWYKVSLDDGISGYISKTWTELIREPIEVIQEQKDLFQKPAEIREERVWSFDFLYISIENALYEISKASGIQIILNGKINNRLITKVYKNETIVNILKDILDKENSTILLQYNEQKLLSAKIWILPKAERMSDMSVKNESILEKNAKPFYKFPNESEF
jgi:SH3-like domain-containing protein